MLLDTASACHAGGVEVSVKSSSGEVVLAQDSWNSNT